MTERFPAVAHEEALDRQMLIGCEQDQFVARRRWSASLSRARVTLALTAGLSAMAISWAATARSCQLRTKSEPQR